LVTIPPKVDVVARGAMIAQDDVAICGAAGREQDLF
jgi:hypothetical protein